MEKKKFEAEKNVGTKMNFFFDVRDAVEPQKYGRQLSYLKIWLHVSYLKIWQDFVSCLPCMAVRCHAI